MAKGEIAERIDGELTVEASPPHPKTADVRRIRTMMKCTDTLQEMYGGLACGSCDRCKPGQML